MGRHGENIRKRSDGRWEARYAAYDGEKGGKVYHSVYGHSYGEAKAKRAAIAGRPGETPEGAGTAGQKRQIHQDMLFGAAAEEWLDDISSRQKPSTCEKYRFIYHCYLEGAFGETALGRVTENAVREKLPCAGLSESLAKSIYCVLNRILQYASVQYAAALPAIKRPPAGTCRETAGAFTKAEQERLLSAVYHETDRFKLAVLLGLLTGLRLGELCSLKWQDIDFENKTLSVKRTVQRLYTGGRGKATSLVETAPKSARSKREIPLQEGMAGLLSGFMDGREYVFGGDKPLDPRTMQNHYRAILEEAGIPYRNFHTIRHTYATNCIEGGADVKSLSEMLGHSGVQITMDYYVHPSMDTKRGYADKLYAFYAGIHGQIRGRAG